MSNYLINYSCEKLIDDIRNSVDHVNTELIDNMTNQNTTYELACIKPNLTYEYFYKKLKTEMENNMNELIKHPGKCNSLFSRLESMYEIASLVNTPSKSSATKMEEKDINEFALDLLAETLSNMSKNKGFEFSQNAMNTLFSFVKTLENNCKCRLVDLFSFILQKYLKVYYHVFEGKTKEEIKQIIKKNFEYFVSVLNNLGNEKNLEMKQNDIINNLSEKLTMIYGFSVESELNKLIPEELGSLKKFFVTVISAYYKNIHPIIWAQILKYMLDNIFKDLPITPDAVFAFLSKCLLLNSGPFILKILQTVRPVLTPEVRQKYNLNELKYPLMTTKQVNIILKKIVPELDLYNIEDNISASVGHVCKLRKVTEPDKVLMVKIIKPLSIAQSCWEYKTLYNVYDKKSCQGEYVKNMLDSTGEEMNVINEIKNIKEGIQYYTCTYSEVYGTSINCKLTTVDAVEGVVNEGCWLAFCMSLAPGIGLNKLIEKNVIQTDTKYRAKLHRCLDLLVYKFFQTLIKSGFYHADLHSGNMFFSYKYNQMTLIDFGSVGRIDIYADDPNMATLIEIIVMSLFYNYDGILDVMTKLINSKCVEEIVDIESENYKKFKSELYTHRLDNIRNAGEEKKKADQYQYDIFSERRISDEQKDEQKVNTNVELGKGIYDKLEYVPEGKEVVVENIDVLPKFTEIMGDTTSVTFAKVLELIITFYAKLGINVAVKFSEISQLQKAYIRLLGVLTDVGYNSYRFNIAVSKAIVNMENVPELRHVALVAKVLGWYAREKEQYDKLGGSINKKIDKATQNYSGACPIMNISQYKIKVNGQQTGGGKQIKNMYLKLKKLKK